MITQNANAPHILVVEDDDNHAALIKRSFEDNPDEYRLEFAGTLLEAWKVIERHSPDLVLTDYILPDGDGNELVVMANDACPVIIMTSHGNEQAAVRAMKIGARDYIVKSPETFDELPRTVKYALMSWALIIARRQADAAILIAKLDWERTFDAVPDLISIIDMNHNITRINRAMADRCGLTPEEMVGRKCHEVMHGIPNLHHSCPHNRMLLDGAGHTEQVVENQWDRVFDITVSPLYDTEGQLTGCVHIARDVTERIRSEEERLRIEQQFQQTQKLESLGVLAGGIAHDFNNILTIIMGHCYVINEDLVSEADQKNHVKQIEKAAVRAADLCRQMLSYAGNNRLVQTRLNILQIVDETVNMLRSAINKNIGIELDLEHDLPEIIGDSAQLQQVVMNLCINAAEAIGDNNGTVKIALKKMDVQTDQAGADFFGNTIPTGSYICLEVTDDGCGMDPETIKRIFEPFYTTKFTGRGLGMSAVLGIIKLHDGSLQLSSTPKCGTTFKVYFPLTSDLDTVVATPAAALPPSAMGSGTILLIDDEEALRIVGSTLLKSMGFSTMTANNGREALEIYRDFENEIDLILLDLLMPDMGGIETYRKLREKYPEISIVICSGYSLEAILEEIDSDPKAAVIQKPYNPELLHNLLIKMIGRCN
ncbi:MAG: response regulator [Desulfuromonadaceae bacterium]|nr:response regulator [Desulfuromonadaceae bacterium]